MATHDKLEQLADALEAQGADDLRVHVLRRAQVFKKSWVKMAEALVEVRNREAYRGWGYDDLYSYCENELHIRRATVDKLTGSFVTLKAQAPQVLKRDGVKGFIPTCDAVDYFAKAIQKQPVNDGDEPTPYPDDVVEELRHAVFEDGVPVTQLRKRFNPVFHPKPVALETIDAIRRATNTARRLERQLEDVPGLPKRRVNDVAAVLEELRAELGLLLDTARAVEARAS